MNWDQIVGNWKMFKGRLREKWGRLNDDDLDVIGGRRDQLIGRLQERYGWDRAEADRHLQEWEKMQQMEKTPRPLRKTG